MLKVQIVLHIYLPCIVLFDKIIYWWLYFTLVCIFLWPCKVYLHNKDIHLFYIMTLFFWGYGLKFLIFSFYEMLRSEVYKLINNKCINLFNKYPMLRLWNNGLCLQSQRLGRGDKRVALPLVWDQPELTWAPVSEENKANQRHKSFQLFHRVSLYFLSIPSSLLALDVVMIQIPMATE